MYRTRSIRSLFSVLWATLLLSAWLLSGCGSLRGDTDSQVDLGDILPENLPAVGEPQRLDADNDGKEEEWLIFYRYKPDEQPIVAAVYRPVNLGDQLDPPTLQPWRITIEPDKYLCQHDCRVRLEDVLSKGAGGQPNPDKELIFEDKVGGKVVRAAIFRWKGDTTGQTDEEKVARSNFVPLGHFDADEVEVKKDQVITYVERQDRSRLIERAQYVPNDSGNYYASGFTLVLPQESEITLSVWPDPALETLYPEKVALAFYKDFGNKEAARVYVSDGAWQDVDAGCPPEVCGCHFKQDNIERVMVKSIAYEGETSRMENGQEVNRCHIITQVICKTKGGAFEQPALTVIWTAEKSEPGEMWKLTSVRPGGE